MTHVLAETLAHIDSLRSERESITLTWQTLGTWFRLTADIITLEQDAKRIEGLILAHHA
jgi:hypothetical protein